MGVGEEKFLSPGAPEDEFKTWMRMIEDQRGMEERGRGGGTKWAISIGGKTHLGFEYISKRARGGRGEF